MVNLQSKSEQYNLRNAHICQDEICVERFACGANPQQNRRMNGNFEHIGQVVRALRKAQKMTLIALADQVDDYDAGNLSRFERGWQGISDAKLKQLALALDTTVSRIHAILEGDAPAPGQTGLFHVTDSPKRSVNEGLKRKYARFTPDGVEELSAEEINDLVLKAADDMTESQLTDLIAKAAAKLAELKALASKPKKATD